MLAGAALGVLLAAGLTALTYAGLIRLAPHRLFRVTGWMVTLLACGLAAQAAGFLQQGGVVYALGATVWDTSAILASSSLAGRVVHTLVGYTDRPTGLQVAAWLATLAAISLLSRWRAPPDAGATLAASRTAN